MPSNKPSSEDNTLTYFGPPVDEKQPSSSNVLSFVFNFFSLKKDQKSIKDVPDKEKVNSSVRPSVLDLDQQKQGTKRKLLPTSLHHDRGSEVELRLRSISAMFKDFPKLMKGPQNNETMNEGQDDISPNPSTSELRQYWMPDDQCHECYDCGEKFTTFRRRHHCRICGQIFCSRCCNQLISGKIMGYPGTLRSCTYCCELVLTFAEGNAPKSFPRAFSQQPSTSETSIEESVIDGQLISDNVLSFGNSHSTLSNSQGLIQSGSNTSLRRHTQTPRHDASVTDDQFFPIPRTSFEHHSLMSPGRDLAGRPPVYIFDATPDMVTPSVLGPDVKDDLVQDSTQLHTLWRKIVDEKQGIEFRDHRFRLRKYSSCVTGQELVDWLLRNDVASTRAQGCAIGQALYEGKWLKSAVDAGRVFQDGYVLYRNGNKLSAITAGACIEIYPDHFANFSDESKNDGLHTMTNREPIWVQEIKCEDEEDENDGEQEEFYEGISESDLTWSDAQNTHNDSLVYSDEDKSISEKSVVSFSSFVEIDEGNDVIKYTRPTSSANRSFTGQQRNMHSPQPSYDDSHLTSISADYLRSFLTWNGTYLAQPWITPSSGWRESDLQSSVANSRDKRAFQWLREMYLRHDLAFLKQLLHEKGLDLAWAEVLVPLAKHAAENVTPNPNVCIDICHYVQIKKVPDGPKKNSEVLNGVVCTKNVVHKQMQSDIENPSILLLAIPLEYHRVQLKLSALDPIVRQEREFYKHLISRITARQPKVILVQCTVSHIAQDLLLQAGITLVINVKPSVMERVARSTEADIVYSIDQLLQAKLGQCARFYIEHHRFSTTAFPNSNAGSTSNVKTLMYFDGCNPRFGCTVLLRGSGEDMPTYKHSTRELTLVQDVFRFLVRAMFHARLELSYLIDQHDFGKLLKKSNFSSKRQSTKNSEADLSAFGSEHQKSNQINEELNEFNNDTVDGLHETVVNKKPILVPLAPPENSSQQTVAKIPSHANSESFKKSLDSTLLTFSPLVQPGMPFLFADENFDSPIHKYLPEKLFWSRAFEQKSTSKSELSAIDCEQRQVIRSRSSTIESLSQDKFWLTAPQNFNRNLNSNEYDDSNTSVETLGSSLGSRDTLGDGALQPIVRRQRLDPNASCYSQQYKTFRDVEGVSASYNTAKLHTWEQKMMDQIFGPPPPERIIPEFPSNASSKSLMKKMISRKLAGSDTNLCEKDKISKCKDGEKNGLKNDTTPLHQFIIQPLTAPASSTETRDLLASFRAHAGMISFTEPPIENIVSTESEVVCTETITIEDEDNVKNVTFDTTVESIPYDCMDPANHQHIYAVFSSYSPQSPNAPYFCVLPWVVDIDFYRGNDITLGGFLERYCFRPSYHCPNATCRRPMVEHIRSFVHGNMCMTVVLKELSKPFQQSSILTWNWDYKTKKSSDIKAMSHDAWCMSFANYLELNLEKLNVPPVSSTNNHKVKDANKHEILDEEWELKPFTSFQYFMFRDIVAAFKCYSVHINEVVFPSPELVQASNNQIATMSNELDEDITTYEDFFLAIESLEEKLLEICETIQDYLHTSHTSKSMNDLPNEDLLKSRNGFYSNCLNTLIDEKKYLLEEIGFLKYLLKSYQTPHSMDDATLKNEVNAWGEEKFSCEVIELPNDLVQQLSTKMLQMKCEICELVQSYNEKLMEAYEKNRSSYWAPSKPKTESPQQSLKHSCDSIDKILEEVEPGEQEAGPVVNENISNVDQSIDSNQVPVKKPNENPHLVNCDDVTPAVEDMNVVEKRSIQKSKRFSADSKVFERSTSYKRLSRTGSSVRLLVTKLLPGNALDPSIPSPYPADEHYLLPECLTTNVVVRDAEPASIIAYTLSMKAYKNALPRTPSTADIMEEKVFEHDRSSKDINIGDKKQSSPRLNGSSTSRESSLIDFPAEEAPDITVLSMSSSSSVDPSNSPHFEKQFSDATTKFYCKVYFASLFEKLRSKVLAGGEAQYLSSMSRSIRWLARGGKSGSTFHKTRDDQFILKQMSYFELQSFLEFAPKYVEYITNCIDNQEATTISKILGVYRISFRNSETNKSLKQDVLVIENLFYQKKVGQIFDLKGSVRNRHAKADVSNSSPESGLHTDHNDIVLLDENFLKLMCDNPLYVHEHTKHLLASAITRDTNFLSKNLIMDYSLLVGVEENNQIVVGIIDFIRTFTWDKKLEMVVKSYGMLGGRKQTNKTMPTVVSPELYKKRFCEAMDRYFQVVPDRWYQMHTF